MSAAAEMPKYQCHKKVWALKIKEIVINKVEDFLEPCEPQLDGGLMYPEDAGYGPVRVDAEYLLKHKPEAGGYYVVYEDGYKSFSPAAAFESGYTRI